MCTPSFFIVAYYHVLTTVPVLRQVVTSFQAAQVLFKSTPTTKKKLAIPDAPESIALNILKESFFMSHIFEATDHDLFYLTIFTTAVILFEILIPNDSNISSSCYC